MPLNMPESVSACYTCCTWMLYHSNAEEGLGKANGWQLTNLQVGYLLMFHL